MFTRYTSHGSVQDLHDIIGFHRRVLHSMSLQGVRHFVSLNDLAEALCERWYQLTQMNDIEESISLFEEALDLCTSRDERRAIILGNLAQAHVHLNMQTAKETHSSSAISFLREALSIAPLHNSVLAILKIRLSNALIGYRWSSGENSTSNLQEAVDVCTSAMSLLPIGHRDRSEALLSHGFALQLMDASEPGNEAQNYAEEARLLLYRVLDTQSPTHPRRGFCLSELGYRLVIAYDRGRCSKADLDEGIKLLQDATTLVTPSHMLYSDVLSNLACGLGARFSHFSENREDIDNSIRLQDQLMNTASSSSQKRYGYVHNLAEALEIRYKHFHDLVDLHRAIALGREAAIVCPPGHHDHEYSVLGLSRRLILDPNCLIMHIDEMVGLLQAILENEYNTEASRSGKSVPLRTMASLLHIRFLRSSDPKDQMRSAELFEAAVQDQSSSFWTRFKAAKQWISAAEGSGSPERAMKAYRMAIHISPYRIYPGLDLSSQVDTLKRNFATISCDAACCALVTANAWEALTLLEQGRATFWAQRLRLRMSFDALPPDLAERLRSATKKLEEYHSQKKVQSALGEQHALEQRLHHESFQQLVREAHLYAGFSDFLHPIQIEQLSGVARNGPLIVLLSSKIYGSFAIIIRDSSSRVEKLPLSSITTDELQAMVGEFQKSVRRARQEMRNAANEGNERLKLDKVKLAPAKAPDVMGKLWSKVGEPIMRHLDIKVSAQQPKTVTNLSLSRCSAMLFVRR
jgi:tetratricopeptide (TPR) repeat protein